MIKFQTIVKYFSRPALTAGLSFFLLTNIPVNSQNLSVISTLERAFAYSPTDLHHLPDGNQIQLRYDFDPLLSEKGRSSRDKYNSSVNSNLVQFGCFLTHAPFKYFLTCSYTDFFSSYRDDYQEYSFQNSRKEWDPSVGLTYNNPILSIGGSIGRHIADNMEREHLYEIQDDVKKYITKGPWQFSFLTTLHLNSLDLNTTLFSGPVHSSLSKLMTIDGSSFRNFPISLIKKSLKIGIDFTIDHYSHTTEIGGSRFTNADLITVSNSMPQDIEISNYSFSHTSTFTHLALSDSVVLEVSANAAGGWFASYNFRRDRYTFFKSDDIRIKNLHLKTIFKLPLHLNFGYSGTYTDISSPEGLLKLSALSSWSVFNPLDYKYSDANLFYYESGVTFDRSFSWLDFTFLPQIEFSYIRTKMSLSYSHKEIIVLFPFFIDPVDKDVFNDHILLLSPSLKTTYHGRSFDVSGSVIQRIPILVIPVDEQDKSKKHGKKHATSSFTGGTSISISTTIQLPQSK